MNNMLITDDRIKVTDKMMWEYDMIRTFHQYGIPIDFKDPSKGLRWVDDCDMTSDDYDTLEKYFLLKLAQQ